MLDRIQDLFAEHEERPNKFTRYFGERVRTAREEAGLSQEDLAHKAYLRRATLSDIENGKTTPDVSAFVLIAYYLKKPLSYFLPEFLYHEIRKEELDENEQELLLHFREIMGKGLQKLAISLVRVIAELNPEEIVLELEDFIHDQKERREAVQALNQKRRKKK